MADLLLVAVSFWIQEVAVRSAAGAMRLLIVHALAVLTTASLQDAVLSQVQAGLARALSVAFPYAQSYVTYPGFLEAPTGFLEAPTGAHSQPPGDFINFQTSPSYQLFEKMMNTAMQPDVLNLALDALTDHSGQPLTPCHALLPSHADKTLTFFRHTHRVA